MLVGLLSILMPLAVTTSCASSGTRFADEVAQEKSISQLDRLGWAIGDPTTIETLERASTVYAGQDWERFKLRLQPGDELRQVEYKAEAGVAVFRHGIYVASYLPVVVLK